MGSKKIYIYTVYLKIRVFTVMCKGPVKLIQRVKIAHLFLQLCQSVPLYYLKLAYVVLHAAVNEFVETPF